MKNPFNRGSQASAAEATIAEIRPDMLPLLQAELNRSPYDDPYSRSAGYLAMTGRKGLWRCGDAAGGVLFCVHPNVEGEILVFPPYGAPVAIALIPGLLDLIGQKGMVARLVRFTDDEIQRLDRHECGAARWRVEETILDWRHPVHVLDIPRTSERVDPAYAGVRKMSAQANRRGVTVARSWDASELKAAVRVTEDWSNRKSSAAYSKGDLAGPAEFLIDKAYPQSRSLNAIIARHANSVVGYFVWEETDTHRGLANGLVTAAMDHVKNVGVVLHLGVCDILRRRGFRQLCIGGSETKGLDAFKRKFRPARSVPVYSLLPPPRASVAA